MSKLASSGDKEKPGGREPGLEGKDGGSKGLGEESGHRVIRQGQSGVTELPSRRGLMGCSDKEDVESKTGTGTEERQEIAEELRLDEIRTAPESRVERAVLRDARQETEQQV